MGWHELEQKQRASANEVLELKRAVSAELSPLLSKQSSPLRKHLISILGRSSYYMGRSYEEVAYAEGYRALARELLHKIEGPS